jgi:heat-inducible transcriptional repressor
MLSSRTETILKSIIAQYIARAVPVPSQSIALDQGLGVSSATVRNEMMRLEQEGYIIRPHTSAGSIPSDKGYRYYVESLEGVGLSLSEQRLVSHLFHQVEKELENWLGLAATLLANQVQNMAVVSVPKSAGSRFKHVELVGLQDALTLVVLVLHGAKVKQKLISFDQAVTQPELTVMANKLNAAFSGLTREQIATKTGDVSAAEQQVIALLEGMMQAEDEQEHDEPYLDGLHFVLNQPEFVQSQKMQGLMELVEHHNLLKNITPQGLASQKVHVVIGKENREETFQDYSVVVSQYGIPDEAVGTVGVIGPTRMQYAHTIPVVAYLASVLSRLLAGLYGKDIEADSD